MTTVASGLAASWPPIRNALRSYRSVYSFGSKKNGASIRPGYACLTPFAGGSTYAISRRTPDSTITSNAVSGSSDGSDLAEYLGIFTEGFSMSMCMSFPRARFGDDAGPRLDAATRLDAGRVDDGARNVRA